MRLCYIADGASIHTRRWLNYLSGKGHEVHLVCWKLAPGLGEGVRVHMMRQRLPWAGGFSPYFNFESWCRQARRAVREISPDVLDGHFVSTYGYIAARTAFRPLVVTVWGSDVLVYARKNPVFRYTAGYAMRRADIVVCTAPAVKQAVVETGIEAGKVRVVVLGGVNREKFRPAAGAALPGLAAGGPVVMSVRALAPLYDVATLIKAAPLVLREQRAARFVIAGAGPQEGYLKRLAADLGVMDSMIFTGLIDHDALPAWLAAADVYVSTAFSDGASNALLEAMACGLSPVVSDIPANRQWVQHSINGLLFPAGDHACLAEKIVQLLGNASMRARFGGLNRRIVAARADTETEMNKLTDIYGELASRKLQTPSTKEG